MAAARSLAVREQSVATYSTVIISYLLIFYLQGFLADPSAAVIRASSVKICWIIVKRPHKCSVSDTGCRLGALICADL